MGSPRRPRAGAEGKNAVGGLGLKTLLCGTVPTGCGPGPRRPGPAQGQRGCVPCREGTGSMGTQLRPETQALAPERGCSLLPLSRRQD